MYSNSIRKAAIEACRELRRNSTEAERIVWEAVRSHRMQGKKFHRQHPIYVEYEGKESFFIGDFYCHDLQLIIEIDGPSHTGTKEEDALRSVVLQMYGIKVERFTNDDVLHHLPKVIANLRNCIAVREDEIRRAHPKSTHPLL